MADRVEGDPTPISRGDDKNVGEQTPWTTWGFAGERQPSYSTDPRVQTRPIYQGMNQADTARMYWDQMAESGTVIREQTRSYYPPDPRSTSVTFDPMLMQAYTNDPNGFMQNILPLLTQNQQSQFQQVQRRQVEVKNAEGAFGDTTNTPIAGMPAPKKEEKTTGQQGAGAPQGSGGPGLPGFSLNGQIVASRNPDGTVTYYDPKTGKYTVVGRDKAGNVTESAGSAPANYTPPAGLVKSDGKFGGVPTGAGTQNAQGALVPGGATQAPQVTAVSTRTGAPGFAIQPNADAAAAIIPSKVSAEETVGVYNNVTATAPNVAKNIDLSTPHGGGVYEVNKAASGNYSASKSVNSVGLTGDDLTEYVARLSIQSGDPERKRMGESLLAGIGRKFSQGGTIDEPVIGTGVFSGETHLFGEKGRERVMPEGPYRTEIKLRSGHRISVGGSD